MQNIFHDGEDHLDDNQADDRHLEARGVLVVELAGENFKEFVDDIESLVEELDAFCNVEVVGCTAVEGFEFRVVPEKFGGVENF